MSLDHDEGDADANLLRIVEDSFADDPHLLFLLVVNRMWRNAIADDMIICG